MFDLLLRCEQNLRKTMHIGTLWQRKAVFFSEAPSLQLLNEVALREFPGIAVNDLMVTTDEYDTGKGFSHDIVLVPKK